MIIDPMQPQENHELARKVKRDRILLNNPVVMQLSLIHIYHPCRNQG